MQHIAFLPISLSLKVAFLLYAECLALLGGGQETILAVAESHFFPKSSTHRELLQHDMGVLNGKQKLSASFPRKLVARCLWRRPKPSFSAFLAGAIAATICISFLVLSCFRYLAASHSGPATQRSLQNRRPGWLCDVRTL